MLNKPIAILGGGNVGHCMAADLSLAGYKVNFYEHPRFKDAFKTTLDTGVINLQTLVTGQWRQAKIYKVTMDMRDALSDARLINVVIPAFGHDLFFDAMIPYLKNGQVVVIYTDNYGSLRLRKLLNDRAPNLKVTIYGTHTMPYGARMVSPGRVNYSYGVGPSMKGDTTHPFAMRVAALPAIQTSVALRELEDLWSGLKAAQNILSVDLGNTNIVVHPLSSLLNTGRIEYSGGDFYLYKEGVTPSVVRADACLLDEMVAVGKAYDCEVVYFSGASIEQFFAPITGDKGSVAFTKSRDPNSLKSRYFTEDIPFGLFGASQLAKKVGLETPIVDATITIGSVVCQLDVRKVGRTLESIGLAELSRDEIINLVQG